MLPTAVQEGLCTGCVLDPTSSKGKQRAKQELKMCSKLDVDARIDIEIISLIYYLL